MTDAVLLAIQSGGGNSGGSKKICDGHQMLSVEMSQPRRTKIASLLIY
jgi:hypothetical protein